MLPRVRASDGPASAPSAVAEVLRLTGPAVLTTLLQTLAFLADRIMLARHSEVALGSMQISGTISPARRRGHRRRRRDRGQHRVRSDRSGDGTRRTRDRELLGRLHAHLLSVLPRHLRGHGWGADPQWQR